jgi:sigma-B regulation protein RsbU (phosphoserine phosphatase)
MMAAPLQTESRVIGLIYVDSRSFIREFTPDDLNLLTVLANVAAIRIEHERLNEVEVRERRRTEDLQQAAEIQRGILPSIPPRVEGFDVAGHNAASRTVGGDYYDFITHQDGRLGVVLADVAGKGMAAAMLMSNLQAMVRILAPDRTDDLAALMSRLDKTVAVNCPSNRFITMFMGIVETGKDELVYCNAGHNPPLVISPDGTVARLAVAGTVLGILPQIGYTEKAHPFLPGDVLAVFSDGVTEAESPAGEEFGDQRLAALLAEHRGESAEQIIALVLEQLQAFTQGAPAADDITLVVMRRTS